MLTTQGGVDMPIAMGTFEINGGREDPFHERDGEPRLVGLQRIEGSVGGRSGAFVIEATSDHDGTQSRGSWRIVNGSGTGELASSAGQGRFEAPGGRTATYRLDYELG
jgi:hypothetical protein